MSAVKLDPEFDPEFDLLHLGIPGKLFMSRALPNDGTVFGIGSIESPTLGLDRVHFVFDSKNLELLLVRRCGCRTGFRLKSLVMELAKDVLQQHGEEDGDAPQTH